MTKTKMNIGIDRISFFTPQHHMELSELADQHDIDINKYHIGLKQFSMAVPSPEEDIVTMAANASYRVIQGVDPESIDMLLLATESSIDQSKSAGIYVHRLLELPENCRVLEFKQACYGATGALQLAMSHVRENPESKVLVIASDVARYQRDTAAEATQGGAAVAMLVSANPRMIVLEQATGVYTRDVMDFWRPNYLSEPIVDGKYSCEVYLQALECTWQQYCKKTGDSIEDFYAFCFHVPFSKMMFKALSRLEEMEAISDEQKARLHKLGETAVGYNKIVGNCYTASLYLSLVSLLENSPRNLTGKKIGLYSYGSGCTAEFFSGRVMFGYEKHLLVDQHLNMLKKRDALKYKDYLRFHDAYIGVAKGAGHELGVFERNRYLFKGVDNHKRIYEVNENVYDF